MTSNRLILTTGETLASAIDESAGAPTSIILMVSRREIERGLTGDAADRLMVLSDSADYTRRFGGRVIVSVDGYDFDPREIGDIPQCKAFFRALTATWPFWFHFAEREAPGTPTLGVIAMLLLDSEVVSRNGRMIGSAVTPASLRAFYDAQFAGLNQLYAFHGISDAENIATTHAVIAAMDRLFQPSRPGDGA